MDLFSGMVNSIWLTTLLILFIVLVLITINIISDFKNYGSSNSCFHYSCFSDAVYA